MKKMILYMGVLLFAVACNNKTTTDTPADETTVATAPAGDYAYTLKEPWKDWQIGGQENIATALKMTKAWETLNLEECASYFGDTAEISLDGFNEVLPHDSIIPLLKGIMSDYSAVKIEMQDYESVVSADKKHEWVTLWYKQTLTDKKGVADSSNIVNDIKFKDGKIIVFDEYVRRFPAGKK